MKKPSLKQILQDEIIKRGFVSYDEVCQIADREGYRRSNAERRLRKSESPMIHTVMSQDNKYIKGYQLTFIANFPKARKEEKVAEKVEGLGI